jgi:hypothetical protein
VQALYHSLHDSEGAVEVVVLLGCYAAKHLRRATQVTIPAINTRKMCGTEMCGFSFVQPAAFNYSQILFRELLVNAKKMLRRVRVTIVAMQKEISKTYSKCVKRTRSIILSSVGSAAPPQSPTVPRCSGGGGYQNMKHVF